MPAGSWLVLPVDVSARQTFDLPAGARFVEQIDVRSGWPLATVPWLHGTNMSLRRQDGPIQSLAVYRISADCVPRSPAGP
jgi:hypothetical protein